MNAESPDLPDPDQVKRIKGIWAFAGGKGGVGRSFLAANFAVQLARTGNSVSLLDLDFDGPSLHAFLGNSSRVPGISLLLESKSARLTDCLQKTPFGELFFARGADGPVVRREDLLDPLTPGIRALGTDFVILDLGSSRTQFTLDLFRLADIGIVVVTPEFLSLQATYGFLSQLNGTRKPRDPSSNGPVQGHPGGPGPAPPERGKKGAGGEPIPRPTPTSSLAVLVNQTRNEEDAFSGLALRSGLWKVLGIPSLPLGSVPHDPAVFHALRRGRPLSLQYPNSPAAQAIGALLKKLDPPPDPASGKITDPQGALQAQDYYEVLEIPRGTTHRQIQTAYEVLRRIYRPGSPFLPPPIPSSGLQRIMDRIDQAYRTLIFLETRRNYDRRLFSSGSLQDPPRKATEGDPGPASSPEDPIDGNQDVPGLDLEPRGREFSGETLRRIRQTRQISLERISEVTKIRKLHLECIEKDNFSYLPAPVFLKGFLRAYAQCLSLDPEEVCQEYMSRYEQWAQTSPETSHPDLDDNL